MNVVALCGQYRERVEIQVQEEQFARLIGDSVSKL
jgi:hypothetical protein